jgi:CubicO group peptidase (beta-lactamase class C family)
VRLLKPETVAEMSRNQLGDIPIRKLPTTAPPITHDLDITGGATAHWGLSWLINPQPGPNGRAAGSLAWAGLANTYYWADPQNAVAGVVMTQMLPFADPGALALFGDFERAVYETLSHTQ